MKPCGHVLGYQLRRGEDGQGRSRAGGGGSDGLPDVDLGLFTHLGAVTGIVLVAEGDSLGAVVLVLENGDENTGGARPFADVAIGACLREALELDGGTQVIDVGDTDVLEKGDALVR